METALAWIGANPWFVILGAVGSIASIWGLYLALRKPASRQTVIAGRNIRNSAIESSGSTDQKVLAGQDIIGSPVKHSSNKGGN